LRWLDPIMLVGCPILIAAMWMLWAAVAVRHRRRWRAALLLTTFWGALNVWIVTAMLLRYVSIAWDE
jgi:hypothetical protein